MNAGVHDSLKEALMRRFILMLNSIIIGLFSRGVGSLESDIGSGVDALCDNDLVSCDWVVE